MPNKHKLSKLVTKQLSKGKLNKNKNVQEALNEIKKKLELENEDIDYDFENIKNTDFEKLDDNDDDTKKIKSSTTKPKKQAEKRKHPDTNQQSKQSDTDTSNNKKQKLENGSNQKNVIPKKSKKNKYFFIAHPEALEKKENIINETDEKLKKKFVIDEEKIKLNEAKKLKKNNNSKNDDSCLSKNNDGSDKKKQKKNKKEDKNKLWTFEECTSSDEEEEKKESKPKNKNTKGNMLDITDIDKSFKLKKKIEVMPDGSKVETLVPEFVPSDNDEIEEKVDEQEESEKESDHISEEEIEEKKSVKIKENNSFKDKLLASRFRYLNEMLYKQESRDSFEYFKNDKDAFTAYHEGFKSQIDKWPVNPLDEIIRYIKSKPANMIVADFGCGEARLAQSVKNKVHSFDFVATNEHVTECDMKNVPIPDNTCDIAVFCLSLMGTNVADFVKEANRVLKSRGILKIAEVVSRIDDKSSFIRAIEALGFKLITNKKDEHNKQSSSNSNNKDYFYFFDFVKVTKPGNKKVEIKLQPCLYKKR